MSNSSSKQIELLSMYSRMANQGYIRTDDKYVRQAFSDMEVRAFRHHVAEIFSRFDVCTLLDYGCGGSDYQQAGFDGDKSAVEFFNLKQVYLYEPARGIDQRTSADAVLCFDVLEHIFVFDLPRIVKELFSLTKKILIVNVACYPAHALLPNGENAHITVRPPFWWRGLFDSVASEYPDITVQLWCSTGWRKVESFSLYKAADWLQQDGFVVNM